MPELKIEEAAALSNGAAHFKRLSGLRAELRGIDSAMALVRFELDDFQRVLKTTISLCAECLRHVPALIFTRGGKVLIKKYCADHGFAEALLENDEQYFFLSNKDLWGRCFAPDKVFDLPRFKSADTGCCCGPGECGGGEPSEADFEDGFSSQMGNKSCMIFAEVTNACNLACPVCYSDAKGNRKLPLNEFKRHILRLIEHKGGLDSVQLTGGEAVLHPEFWEMIAFLYQQPVRKIYLPTNGIVFARKEVAERLREFRDRVMLQLQFDGQGKTNETLRAAEPSRIRMEVLELAREMDIQTQITMTVTRGLNEHEIGWVVDQGMRYRNIKVIALQPVTYSGRYDLPQDPLLRITLSDIVKAVVAQARKKTRPEDYVPIPCSHPNCGWVTLFLRRFGLTTNIVKYVDLPKAIQQVSNKAMLTTNELREAVGNNESNPLRRVAVKLGRRLVRSKDMLTIGIKPYMDRFSYDQDRISNCCTHLLDTHGNPVSFCEYNALVRQRDSWDRLPTMPVTKPIHDKI